MGKLNEVQEQMTQSYGSNSFTTTIKDTTVEFDSAKDKFTFKDPIEVPSISVNGQESVAFTSDDRVKLDNLQTPMQIKGRVDSVSELPTEGVKVGDTYLVGLSGSETFDEYVCVSLSGSPEVPEWESVGTTQVQSDWNQNDNTKADYIKNRICYQNIVSRGYSSNDADAQEVYNEWDEKIGWYTPNASITEADVLSFIGRNLTAVYEFETVENTIESYSEPFSGWFGLKQISTNVYAIYGTVDDDYIAAISLADGEEGMLGFETLNKGVYFSAILESYNMDGISEYVTLDDNYISSNIARVSDIKQSDWNQSDSEAVDYIKNKPTIPSAQVQADWDQNDSSATDFIKNRMAYKRPQIIYCDTDSTASSYTWNFDWENPIVAGGVYDMIFVDNGEEFHLTNTATQSGNKVYLSGPAGGVYYSPSSEYSGHNGNFVGPTTVSHISVKHQDIKTIDPDLLPTYVNGGTGISSLVENDKNNIASGKYSHCEGYANTASGNYSHCEGYTNTASGAYSHCGGFTNTASGKYSHCFGEFNIASGDGNFVFGRYNVADLSGISGKYIEIVGNGVTNNQRSNARTLDLSGNEQIAGTLRIGSTSTGGALLKFESNSLKVSFDNGTTWLTISAS